MHQNSRRGTQALLRNGSIYHMSQSPSNIDPDMMEWLADATDLMPDSLFWRAYHLQENFHSVERPGFGCVKAAETN